MALSLNNERQLKVLQKKESQHKNAIIKYSNSIKEQGLQVCSALLYLYEAEIKKSKLDVYKFKLDLELKKLYGLYNKYRFHKECLNIIYDGVEKLKNGE